MGAIPHPGSRTKVNLGVQRQLKQSGLGICADGLFQLREEVFPIADLSGGGSFEQSRVGLNQAFPRNRASVYAFSSQAPEIISKLPW
jgi:hypothetical protein